MITRQKPCVFGAIPWTLGWALLAHSCGSPPGSQADDPPSRVEAPTAAPAQASPAVTTESAAGSTAEPSVLGAEEHEVGGVDVSLTQVQRASGDTLMVQWSYRNTTQDDKLLAAGVDESYVPYLLTGEAYLVDPTNMKKYLVVRDANDNPVASTHGGPAEIYVPARQTITAWAKFPAPSTDVETISVYIPNLPPFENIPISQE